MTREEFTHDDVRALSSDYLDGALDVATQARLVAFLATHPEAQADMDAMRRTLSVLHALPPREPSLDLWREFTPHMAAYSVQRRLRWDVRLRQVSLHLLDGISAGLILWTQALAGRTRARWERHLLHDPMARQGGQKWP